MIPFILGLMAIVAIVLLVAAVAMGIALARRCWWWLGPLCVTGLTVCVALGLFDALATAGTPSQKGPAASNKSDADNGHRSDEIDLSSATVELPPATFGSSDPQAPDWTRRKPGELDMTKPVPDVVIYAGPKLDHAACEAELKQELMKAVDQFITTQFGVQRDVRLQVPAAVVQSLVYENYECKSKRAGTATSEPQEMVEMYALVKFDKEARGELNKLCHDSIVQSRMKTAGTGLAAVLGVLTVAWAIMRRR